MEPLGVVLAGGAGRRMGGSKALASLAGRPLIAYPVQAMRAAVGEVVVVAKLSTRLPALEGARIVREAQPAHHPLVGIREALRVAGDRPVLVCPADLPFVDAALLRTLAYADAGEAPAVVAANGGDVQPLLGCYRADVLDALPSSGSMREAVAAIGARLLDVPELALFNVNTPEDLAHAEALIAHASPDKRRGTSADWQEPHV